MAADKRRLTPMKALGCGGAALCVWSFSTLVGQQPQFEAVSIRPHVGAVTVSGLSMTGSQIAETAVSLVYLVADANDMKAEQVSGGPDWTRSSRYDVLAKTPGNFEHSREQLRQMLRLMLADRFKLQVHRETEDTPVYALVVAKSGSKLKTSDKPTGVMNYGSDAGRRVEGSVTMDFLARMLESPSGRKVVDRTNMAGNYAMTLEFTPLGFTPPDNVSPVSIFTAVQEQLGLRLESARAPVERLVIDRAEKPDLD